MKTVITMTSYPKRIHAVAEFIYIFFRTQTIKPDYFYLWLSEEEFPNHEYDLPRELVAISRAFNIQIRWVPYNDGCTKRWNVYPAHMHDVVVAVDEDNVYDIHLVEEMRKYTKRTGRIYAVWESLTNYLVPVKGIDFAYKNYAKLNLPDHSLRMKMSGNSVIPPDTFPMEALNPQFLPLRLKYCRKCDESWLQPFFRCNGIESSTMHLHKYACDDSMNATGINATGKRIRGVWWKNLQMYIVLRLFPDMLIKWKRLFPEYNDSEFSSMELNDLGRLLYADIK